MKEKIKHIRKWYLLLIRNRILAYRDLVCSYQLFHTGVLRGEDGGFGRFCAFESVKVSIR